MASAADSLLAIETSGMAGGVALALRGEIVAERVLPGLRRNAAELLPAIQEILAAYSMRVRDVGVVAFSGGPGSFTGVRVAATVARMLNSVAPMRVVRVSTLEAIAENAVVTKCQTSADASQSSADVFHGQPLADDSPILAMLDAKRGQVYAACYAIENAQLREVVTARAIEPQEMLATISKFKPPANWLAIGEGVAACREALENSGVRITDASLWKPTAGGVARCGLRAVAAGRFATLAEMLPIYLRPPECEEVYESRRKAAMERRGEGPATGARIC